MLALGNNIYRHPAARFAYYKHDGRVRLYVNGEVRSCGEQLAALLSASNDLDSSSLASAMGNDAESALIDWLWRSGALVPE